MTGYAIKWRDAITVGAVALVAIAVTDLLLSGRLQLLVHITIGIAAIVGIRWFELKRRRGNPSGQHR